MKRLWAAAGYSTDVTVEFHRLSGTNLDEMAQRAKGVKALSNFCDKAQEKGLSAAECARLIYDGGWEDISALDICRLTKKSSVAPLIVEETPPLPLPPPLSEQELQTLVSKLRREYFIGELEQTISTDLLIRLVDEVQRRRREEKKK
jgi:hypothetical protein